MYPEPKYRIVKPERIGIDYQVMVRCAPLGIDSIRHWPDKAACGAQAWQRAVWQRSESHAAAWGSCSRPWAWRRWQPCWQRPDRPWLSTYPTLAPWSPRRLPGAWCSNKAAATRSSSASLQRRRTALRGPGPAKTARARAMGTAHGRVRAHGGAAPDQAPSVACSHLTMRAPALRTRLTPKPCSARCNTTPCRMYCRISYSDALP